MATQLRKYLPFSISSQLSNMTQETQGVQSTKPADDDHLHPTIRQDKRTIYVFADIFLSPVNYMVILLVGS